MAVAFDAVGPSSAGTSSRTTPLTWSHVNSGNGILVGATTFTGSSNAVTSVTYGGVSIPLLGFAQSGAGGMALYGLVGPTVPTGTNTVSVVFTGAADTIGGSVSVSGAGSLGTPVVFNTSSNGTSASTSVPGTTTGGLIVAGAAYGGGAAIAGTNSVTIRYAKAVSPNSGADDSAVGTVPSTGGGAAQTVGFSSTASDQWHIVAVEVLPASGGAVYFPPRPRPPGLRSPMAFPARPVPVTQPYVQGSVHSASAVLTGSGSLGAAGTDIKPGAAGLTGSGALSAAPTEQLPGAAGLDGNGSLGATGTDIKPGSASLTGQGTLGATGFAGIPGAVGLTGSGSLTAAGQVQYSRQATLTGSGVLGAAGVLAGSAALTGSGSLGAAGTATYRRSAGLTGQGVLSASGAFAGLASLTGQGALGATASVTYAGQAALSGVGVLSASFTITAVGQAALSGQGTLGASAIGTVPGAASLTGSGTLGATAILTLPGAAGLSGAGTLGAAWLVLVPGAASLTGRGQLGAAGLVTVPGAAGLAGSGSLSAAAIVIIPGSGSLAGAGQLGAAQSVARAGLAGLYGTGTLTATARVTLPVTEPPVTWAAWPAGPRWITQPARRWFAWQQPGRWDADAGKTRWRTPVQIYLPISALSTEYVDVLWFSDLNGTTIDPTGQTTGQPQLQVQFAFPVSSGNPASPAQPVTWYTGSWLSGTLGKGYIAQCLVGPNGVVTLVSGTAYDVWSKVTGNPEIPTRYAGTQKVY